MCPKGLSTSKDIRGTVALIMCGILCPKGLSALYEIGGTVALIMHVICVLRVYLH